MTYFSLNLQKYIYILAHNTYSSIVSDTVGNKYILIKNKILFNLIKMHWSLVVCIDFWPFCILNSGTRNTTLDSIVQKQPTRLYLDSEEFFWICKINFSIIKH